MLKCDTLTIAVVSEQVYDPIVAWACKAFGTDFVVSNSIFGTPQPDSAVDCVRSHLEGRVPDETQAMQFLGTIGLPVCASCWFNGALCCRAGLSPWRLAATEQLVSACRSVIVGLAISMVGAPMLPCDPHHFMSHCVYRTLRNSLTLRRGG
jgi:hypothetical protein